MTAIEFVECLELVQAESERSRSKKLEEDLKLVSNAEAEDQSLVAKHRQVNDKYSLTDCLR